MIWLDILAGALTGILSGWGIGGGSLLMLYMSAVRGAEQQIMQGINLAYFLPVSAGSLINHIKNRLIDKQAVIITTISGILSAFIAAFLANSLDVSVMKKFFAVFLIIIGLKELFHKNKKKNN